MDKDEALKLALRMCDEALPKFNWGASFLDANAIQLLNTVPAAIKKALGQPAQEPVATIDSLEQEIYENTREFVSLNVMEWLLKRLNTTPPKREWVGLTIYEIDEAFNESMAKRPKEASNAETRRLFYQAIEQALKEKNNGT